MAADSAATVSGPASTEDVAPGPTVKTFRDQLRAHRKQAEPKPAAEAASAVLPGPVRPAAMRVAPPLVPKHIPPTEPKPFKFATDARMKPKAADSGSQVDFSKTLRGYQPSSSAAVSSNKFVRLGPLGCDSGHAFRMVASWLRSAGFDTSYLGFFFHLGTSTLCLVECNNVCQILVNELS